MSSFVLSAFADEIDADLYTQMDVLDQHGIKYIEMRGVNGHGLVFYSLDQVKEFKKELDTRGFKISAVGSPIGKIGINDDFEAHLELFKHTLEIAKLLNTKYIRMFSFYIPENEPPEKYKDEVINRWREFIKAAEGTGIILLHENEKGIYGDTPERCLDLMETLNCEYVKMTFDPANFVQCDVTTYPHAFKMLRDYIEYIHIKDAKLDNHQVVPAGQGDGHVREILTELKNMNYNGFLSIEPHLGNFTGFATLEPGVVGADLPNGGPKQFAIAAHALKELIKEV